MRSQFRRRPIRVIVGLSLIAILSSILILPVDAAPATRYPVLDFTTSAMHAFADPAASPPGVNVPCRLSLEHPRPIVLINGTHASMMLNWGGLGPVLANAGYCVYSETIGGHPDEFVQTCGPVRDSIDQISRFIDDVLLETGARTVDIVGHSQGGLIAEYYTKFHGRDKVSNVALLSPTTHGSTLSGATLMPEPARSTAIDLQAFDCAAVYDQLPTSDVVRALNDGPVTVLGVSYTVIETRYEVIVTPGPSAAFIDEEGVENLIVQDFCGQDFSDHILLAYSTTAWMLVLGAFDDSAPTRIRC
ncbi:esterase/lipase family protein [Rhodococcus sp. IEGM1428]|uniref:esterase/lipase family protein n=1 Tax=Rhodococcus sp. IEGM1428 TaxID=3392191 RepID=UPI003D1175C6